MIFFRKKGKMRKKIYFIVMNNVFSTSKMIHRRYDLKGSTQGRETITSADMKIDPTVALKEVDLIKSGHGFKVGKEMKRKILGNIHKDTHFFAENNINDYSLLIGVHDRSSINSPLNSRINTVESEQPSPLNSKNNLFNTND